MSDKIEKMLDNFIDKPKDKNVKKPEFINNLSYEKYSLQREIRCSNCGTFIRVWIEKERYDFNPWIDGVYAGRYEPINRHKICDIHCPGCGNRYIIECKKILKVIAVMEDYLAWQ